MTFFIKNHSVQISPDFKSHSLPGVEVVRDDSPGLEGHLDAGVLEDPGDLDVRPAGLLVLLHDDPLVGRLLRHRRGHLAAVGGLQTCDGYFSLRICQFLHPVFAQLTKHTSSRVSHLFG